MTLAIEPANYSQNEAWLLFRLNEAPVQTEKDGDFNALAIMEIASGTILGVEMVATSEQEISELQSRRLLGSAERQAGSLPKEIIVPLEPRANQLINVAEKMGIQVARHPMSEIAPVIQETVEGFAAHVLGERQ